MLKNTVREWRLRTNITKAALARRIGVCRSYVTKLELGTIQASGEVMFRIAEYFNVRVEDVFQRADGTQAGRPFFGSKSSPKGNGLVVSSTRPAGFEKARRISPSSASAAGRS